MLRGVRVCQLILCIRIKGDIGGLPDAHGWWVSGMRHEASGGASTFFTWVGVGWLIQHRHVTLGGQGDHEGHRGLVLSSWLARLRGPDISMSP